MDFGCAKSFRLGMALVACPDMLAKCSDIRIPAWLLRVVSSKIVSILGGLCLITKCGGRRIVNDAFPT